MAGSSRAKNLIVIAATPRSGSTLLARTLKASGATGPVAEVLMPETFHTFLRGFQRVRCFVQRPDRVLATASRRSINASLQRMASSPNSRNGILCIKVMWTDLESVLHRHELDLPDLDIPITWIRINRSDRLRQAVSWARAEQTQSWSSESPEERPPIYDFSQIRKFVGYLERDNESWDSYLRSQASHALEITYEQLIADYQGNVRRALDHIGAFGCDVPTPPIQKQADEINEDWVERFQTDVEEFGF